MSEKFFFKGLKKLNSRELVNAYVEEYTAYPYIQWIESLSFEAKIKTIITLYRDLTLDVPTLPTLEAKSRNLEYYDLEPLIIASSPDTIYPLLEIIEKYGFCQTFNEKGSEMYKKYGAFTPESRLAANSVFLIAQCKGINDLHIKKMQEILAKRVKFDENLSITSTLAENIARVLNELKPSQFPKSIMNQKTNQLDNPEPFLPK